MRWPGRLLLLIGAFLLGLLLWTLRNTTPETISGTPSPSATTSPPERTAAASMPVQNAGEPGPMTSGKLRMTSAGHLILDRETRRIFDQHLDARDAGTSTGARRKLLQTLQQQLSGAALSEAVMLMDSYIGYRKALAELDAMPDSSDLTNTQQARLKISRATELRSRYFDSNISQLFFADEDAMNDYSVSQMEIMQDKSLSTEQKLQRLEELKKKLPYALP